MKKVLSYLLMIALFVSMSGLNNFALAADTTNESVVASNTLAGQTAIYHIMFQPGGDVTDGSIVLTFDSSYTITANNADFVADEHQALTVGERSYNSGVLVIPFTGTLDNAYPVTIRITSVTNPSTSGTYAVDIATKTTNGTAVDQSVDPDASIAIADNTVSQSVSVARVMEYSITDTSHAYSVNPAVPALAFDTASANISIKSNATSTDLTLAGTTFASSNDTIAKANLDYASWTNEVGFGFSLAASSGTFNAIAITGSSYNTTGSATNFKGLDTTSSNLTILNDEVGLSNTADVMTVTYRVLVDYTVEADTYTSTSTYVLTPTYSDY